MKKTVLFLLPFGKMVGMGHLTREVTLAVALRQAGYRVVLWSDGDVKEIGANFKKQMDEGFDEVLTPADFIEMKPEDKSRFPSAQAVGALDSIEGLAAIVVDDFRRMRDPERIETLKALTALAHRKGAKVAMVGSNKHLEFEFADHVINYQMLINQELYAPDTLRKMISGLPIVPLKDVAPEPLPQQLPPNAFGIMIGATDPKNSSQPILEGMIGSGYNPVLIAAKSVKPEDQAKEVQWQKTLAKFPSSAWLSGLSAGQMKTLRLGVRFMFIGPGSVTCAEHFLDRCPFVGVYSNPELENSILALEKMGQPTLQAQNQKEFNAAWKNELAPVSARFAQADILQAVRRLEELGYIENRLPDVAPFNQVDEKGAERIVKALGLSESLMVNK